MSKHTEGPWDVKAPVKRSWVPAFSHVVCARSRFLVDGHAPEAPIADIHTLSFSGTHIAQANARLIAAAPDLLDALKMLLADIEDYQRINHLGGENNHSQVVARAAIAKAEGA